MLQNLIPRGNEGVASGALQYDPLQYCIIAAGTAIAWAYMIELDLVVFYTFRRRKGLYFWSLLVSSWGCSLHALGFIFKFLLGSKNSVTLPFIEVGWVSMVTGQALVLYSRLHLVVRNPKTLRYVLWMIIIDALILHVPTILFTCGSNSANHDFWTPKFNVMERIQLIGFCLQEFAISTVYIVSTVRLLGSIYHSMTRKVMMQLLAINFICIGMDIVLIGLEFSGEYVYEAAIKPMIYAIKLKLEFAVLNQLMGLTRAGFTEESHNRAEAAAGHELRNRTLAAATHDPENPPDRKVTTWIVPEGTRNGSYAMNRVSVTHPDQIYKTQHVVVASEPTNVNSHNDSSLTSSSTAVTVGEQKSKSLMGTTVMAGRGSRISKTDPEGRRHSPTESEIELKRKSIDSEKEGTRWIEGELHD